ncbi:O-antigen ligase family protein [Anaerolineales bacterium]
MYKNNSLQNWVAKIDPRAYAILIGLSIGLIAGVTALSIAVLGPALTIAIILGILLGLYILTDLSAALYGIIMVMFLLPFGTSPVKIGFTPTLIDFTLGAFLLVYAFQWMTGRRRAFQFLPVQAFIAFFLMWLILAFAFGLRYGMPTSTNLRQFAEMLLAISMVFILPDIIRDKKALRRLSLVIILAIACQSIITLILYIVPESTTENLLVRLARLGYPNGGVIRYIEDNPALAERAIGTWVDPNALGGIMATGATLMMTQIFARKPIIHSRWLNLLILACVGLGLLLTFSRASFLAFGVGVVLMAFLRYRKLIPLMIIAGLLFLMLPQTQDYIERLVDAFQGEDLATQMRVGEWSDSIDLIREFPLLGIGFTGTPRIGLYADVANMYLIMGNKIGLMGVIVFLTAMGAVLTYGYKNLARAFPDPDLEALHLGYHVMLVVILINAVADHYYFRLDFQGSIMWMWLIVALAIISSHLAQQDNQPLLIKEN